MSNRTTMAQINAIGNLYRSGHSNHQIARILGLNRVTAGKYVAAIKAAGLQNQPNPQTGSDGVLQRESLAVATAAKHSLNGPASSCQSSETIFKSWLDRGQSIKRIHPDLQSEHGFKGSYFSVYLLATKLSANVPLPHRRLEVEPVEEAQIDFGTGSMIINSEEKQRRPWMFRIVLSQSCKAVGQAVLDHFQHHE